MPSPEIFVVSSHFREDVSWLDSSGYPYLVVSKGEQDPEVKNFRIIPNRGVEFASYIWFILNYWDDLPSKMAFIHGHVESYHQMYRIPEAIRIFEGYDFHGLNGEFSVAIHRLDSEHPWFGRKFSDAWNFLGLDSVAPPPSFSVFQPGTQTVLSKELIISKGRSFYEKIFEILMCHEEHYRLALVVEVAWQVIFGMLAVHPLLAPDEFLDFFHNEKIQILICHPGRAWHSLMGGVAIFDVPNSKDMWILRCLEAFQKSVKVY